MALRTRDANRMVTVAVTEMSVTPPDVAMPPAATRVVAAPFVGDVDGQWPPAAAITETFR